MGARSDDTKRVFLDEREGFVIPFRIRKERGLDGRGRYLLRRYRIWFEFEPETGCWRWPLGKNPKGYGAWWWEGSVRGAHRWVYEQVHKVKLPRNLVVDHVRNRGCEYRDCVRPSHLEAVTVAENIRRGKWPTVVRDLKLRGESKAA